MTDTLTDDTPPPEVTLLIDPAPPAASPLILTDGYVEINGVNLRCLGLHFEVNPEDKPIDVTTFCGIQEYPGPIKWHFVAKFAQSFDPGATDAVLYAAVAAYAASGTLSTFKVRGKSALPASTINPEYAGTVVPKPYRYIGGDAGSLSEVDIDWVMTAPPTKNVGAVAATGATAGSPGFFTPPGAVTPANLAALTGLTATPAATWATGQWVATADGLANNWNGTTWVAGKHP